MAHDDAGAATARPTAVTVAFWLLLAGAAMLVVGGLLTALVSFGTLRQVAPATVADQSIRDALPFYRGAGTLAALAGVALAAFAWRAWRGDPRARRATMSLALAIVVVVAVGAVFAGTQILTLMSLPLVIIGTLLLGRPASAAWFAGGYPDEPDSGEPPFTEYPQYPQDSQYPQDPQDSQESQYPRDPRHAPAPESPDDPGRCDG